MKIPQEPHSRAGISRQIINSDASPPNEAASILAGLEKQKEELGPIAEELIALLRSWGVGAPQRRGINPSSE